MQTIAMHEAKSHLSRYLADIEANDAEFIIARGGKSIARQTALGSRRSEGVANDS